MSLHPFQGKNIDLKYHDSKRIITSVSNGRGVRESQRGGRKERQKLMNENGLFPMENRIKASQKTEYRAAV